MARKTIHSTGGFWLILGAPNGVEGLDVAVRFQDAAAVYGLGALLLAASLRLLFWAAVAAAVHELGHVAAVRALGGRVGSFRLTGVGAVIQPRRERMFSYGEECLVALAGPAASVLLAIGAAAWGRHFGGADAYLLTGVSLALGVFNLLPIGPLDGGRILRAVASRWAGPDAGDRVCGLLTKVLAAGLAALGVWVLGKSGNFTLLLCAGWLLWRREGSR